MTYLLISLFISTMKTVVDISMELLGPKEQGIIYVKKNGMYPLYRIAEVLLGSKEKLCFVHEEEAVCEQVCLKQDVIVMDEAI